MHRITRCIVFLIAVLAVAGAARDSGAQGRFTSTVKFVPPPPDSPPAPAPSGPFSPFTPFGPFVGRGPFAVGAFWPWGAWLPVPVYFGPPAVASPLKDAPVGGVQLDVDPRRAQVYVDGTYTGLVEEFSGYFQHLDLPAGPHVIAIVAPDYQPLTMYVTVTPGATTTHRATLSRAYGH